jgi:hypothetical protein
VVVYLGGEVTLIHEAAMRAVATQQDNNPLGRVAGFAQPRAFVIASNTALPVEAVAANERAFCELERLGYGSDTGTDDLLPPPAGFVSRAPVARAKGPVYQQVTPTQPDIASPKSQNDVPAEKKPKKHPKKPKTPKPRPAPDAAVSTEDDSSDDEDDAEIFETHVKKGVKCKACKSVIAGPMLSQTALHDALKAHKNTDSHIKKSQLWLTKQHKFQAEMVVVQAALGEWLGEQSCFKLCGRTVQCTVCGHQCVLAKNAERACEQVEELIGSARHWQCLARHGAASPGPLVVGPGGATSRPIGQPAAIRVVIPHPARAHGPLDAAEPNPPTMPPALDARVASAIAIATEDGESDDDVGAEMYRISKRCGLKCKACKYVIGGQALSQKAVQAAVAQHEKTDHHMKKSQQWLKKQQTLMTTVLEAANDEEDRRRAVMPTGTLRTADSSITNDKGRLGVEMHDIHIQKQQTTMTPVLEVNDEEDKDGSEMYIYIQNGLKCKACKRIFCDPRSQIALHAAVAAHEDTAYHIKHSRPWRKLHPVPSYLDVD